jgi:hypothetical protein
MKIADAADNKPVLDVGCGSGRNAVLLSRFGCTVVCLDKDLTSLHTLRASLDQSPLRKASAELIARQVDLEKDRWPFTSNVVGGIISVHFFMPVLFPHFTTSLSSGGYLLLQTVPGCGGNYVELPKALEVRSTFEMGFSIEFYKEHKVGPPGSNAVTVQMLAKKRPLN